MSPVKTSATSHHIQKLTQKWITLLNVRTKTINRLEENMEVNHHDLACSNGFLDMTSNA